MDRKRLVFITQEFDPKSTILGVTREWVAALAERCQGVDVIALAASTAGPALSNVRVASLGKEHGARRGAQLRTFYRALAEALPGAAGVFVHMVPRYAVLAYPLALAARRPLALWYAQGGVDAMLRAASQLVTWIATPNRESFPLGGPRVDRRIVITGHGINTQRYAPDGGRPVTPKRLLASGRLSPSKRYEALLKSAAALPRGSCTVRLVGGRLHGSEGAYELLLRDQARALGIADLVEFAGLLPYAQMPAEYRAAWAMAHTSATGGLDKVVLEAMACGTPAVSTAPATRAVLGTLADTLWCDSAQPEALSAKLAEVLSWTLDQRAEVGAAVRAQVEQQHSLCRWADQVTELLTTTHGRGRVSRVK